MKTKQISQYLFISNPFYIISAACVLYAIYALLNSGQDSELSSMQLSVLMMGYTSVLNVVALILIRMKRVWEDSRTLVVLTMLLLLATPMLMDEFLIQHSEHSSWILHVYFAFILSQVFGFFYFSKIQLPFLFHGFVALSLGIYIYYPHILMDYVIEPNRNLSLVLIYLFPFLMAVPCFICFQAFKSISKKMKNPTPWGIPYNPWLLFVLMLFCVPFKTYSLLMVYVPGKSISPETCFTFMMPIFATLALFFMKVGEWKAQSIYVRLFWLSLYMGLGLAFLLYEAKGKYLNIQEMYQFYGFSHIYISVWLCVLMSGYAFFKGTPKSKKYFILNILLLSVCRPETYGYDSFFQPNLYVVMMMMGILIYFLYSKWDSKTAFACLCMGFYLLLQYNRPFEDNLRDVSLNLHLLFVALMAITYISKDRFSLYLEFAAALMYPSLVYLNMLCFEKADWGLVFFMSFMAVSCFMMGCYSYLKQNLIFLYAFFVSWAVQLGYVSTQMMEHGGWPKLNENMMTLYFGLCMLVCAVVTSFSKAGVIKFTWILTFLKRAYEIYIRYQRQTFSRDIHYPTAFLPTCLAFGVLGIFYRALLSMTPPS